MVLLKKMSPKVLCRIIYMSEEWKTLAIQHAHERDKEVRFVESTHTYYVRGSKKDYISTTGFYHAFFPHFNADATISKMMAQPNWSQSKYYGKTAAEIKEEWSSSGKEASSAGTEIHLAIEQFLNGAGTLISDTIRQTKEWNYFMDFWKEFSDDLEPYRTEWEVWDEEYKLTGSIDMVFKRKSDNTYHIYDWKRSKEIKMQNSYEKGLGPLARIDNCNFWHYTIQLNIYRWFLEKNYGLKIGDMVLVILHPLNKSFLKISVKRLDKEIQEMMECRMRALQTKAKVPVVFPDRECLLRDE